MNNIDILEEKEKKAIDVIKSLGISLYNGKSQIISGDTTKEISTAIYTTINLIEKQSKEIEELRNEVMEKELIIDGMKEDRRIAVEEIQEQYYVSKDKIKAIIEETKNEKLNYSEDEWYLEDEIKGYSIEKLQSLLGKE